MTEGNPSVDFAEINDTIAVFGNISHLSEQEYRDFPDLKKVIENQRNDSPWNNGYRYLGSVKISEQQRATIYKYIKNIDLNDNYLEYGGNISDSQLHCHSLLKKQIIFNFIKKALNGFDFYADDPLSNR